MLSAVKLGINCLVVGGLTLAGIVLFARLPRFTLEPLQWVGQHVDRPATMVFWFVYTVLLWTVLGAVIAWAMMLLEPRKVVLYGSASAVTFIITSQSWSLIQPGNAYPAFRELVFVLTIPVLYAVFVRLTRRRHDASRNGRAGSARTN